MVRSHLPVVDLATDPALQLVVDLATDPALQPVVDLATDPAQSVKNSSKQRIERQLEFPVFEPQRQLEVPSPKVR